MRIPWWTKLAVSAVVLAFLVYRVDVAQVIATFEHLRPRLLGVALTLYIAGQLLSAAKWKLVATALGFRRTYAEYVRFYFIGMFFNLAGPSTLGGDLVRALALGHGERRALALNSVMFDRVSGLVVLVSMGLAALLAFPQYGLPPALAHLTGGIVVVLLGGWWMLPRVLALVLPATHRVRVFVERDLAALWRDQGLLASVVIVSVSFHLVQVTVQYTLALALGLSVPFSYCLIFHPAVSILAALPITVSGLGMREGGYVFFLRRIGVTSASALSFGLAWFGILVLGALPGGLLLITRRDMTETIRAMRS
jgi:uncharacterized membrane protein YbhN (UPF0104 family)